MAGFLVQGLPLLFLSSCPTPLEYKPPMPMALPVNDKELLDDIAYSTMCWRTSKGEARAGTSFRSVETPSHLRRCLFPLLERIHEVFWCHIDPELGASRTPVLIGSMRQIPHPWGSSIS